MWTLNPPALTSSQLSSSSEPEVSAGRANLCVRSLTVLSDMVTSCASPSRQRHQCRPRRPKSGCTTEQLVKVVKSMKNEPPFFGASLTSFCTAPTQSKHTHMFTTGRGLCSRILKEISRVTFGGWRGHTKSFPLL